MKKEKSARLLIRRRIRLGVVKRRRRCGRWRRGWVLRFSHVCESAGRRLAFSVTMVQGSSKDTYANAFTDACGPGVPVREEPPESSAPRVSEPPGPILRPLLLRELNIDVGPKVTLPLAARDALPLRRRKSSIPTVFEAGLGWKLP